MELELEEVSLTETLRHAARRTEAAQAGARIAVDVPEEAVLRADPGRLAQALDNLLENAGRHGAAPISLTGRVQEDEIRIGVTDAGPGVPTELVPRLFERFSIAGSSGGTGLGLYLVREVAREHGGEAAYHAPSAGQPSTFEIRLPRHR